MNSILKLAGRNIKIYLRDRAAVFFSLLSMLIVIVLMLVFLGDMNVESITKLLAEYGVGSAEDNDKHAQLLVLLWTIGGVLCVNGVTVTTMTLSIMINDAASGRLNSFRTAPISRASLAMGYIFSSWAASVFICLITLAAGELFAAANGAQLPDVAGQLGLIGVIALNSFTYAGVMYFAATLVRTQGAWSGFSTLTGTLVGFLGGIYLPIGSLPEAVQTALKCLPTIYGCSVYRSILTENALAQTFEGAPAQLVSEYGEAMGITLKFGETEIGMGLQLAILAGYGIIFAAAAALISKRRVQSDR